jgi:hypothetical protein
MNDWIATFEAAKAAQVVDFSSKTLAEANSPSPYNSDLPNEDRDDNSQNTPSRRRERTGESARFSEVEDDGDDDIGLESSKNIDEPEEECEEEPAVVVNIEEVGASDANSNDKQKEEDFVDTDVAYPDSVSTRRNRELHSLLKSVPATDFVIEAFACGLQKDIIVQGKAYATQNRMCFYSNILGFVNVVCCGVVFC